MKVISDFQEFEDTAVPYSCNTCLALFFDHKKDFRESTDDFSVFQNKSKLSTIQKKNPILQTKEKQWKVIITNQSSSN